MGDDRVGRKTKGADRTRLADQPAPARSSKRTEMVSVRLDPRLRYAADLAARSQRRSVSSLIDVAVNNYLATLEVNVPNEKPTTLSKLVEAVWDPAESDRFVNLAENHRWLFDSEEELRWKAIKKHFGAEDRLTRQQREQLRAIYHGIKQEVANKMHQKI